jgi:hypothetical protein
VAVWRPSLVTAAIVALVGCQNPLAYVVGEARGLSVLDSARDYIHLCRGDRDALGASLHRIQRAATTILSALDGA